MTSEHPLSQILLQRIQRDYEEQPGLRLTPQQAQRFWGLDGPTCGRPSPQMTAATFLREECRMGGLCFGRRRRWSSAVLASAMWIGPIALALSGCSGSGPFSQAKDAPIRVEASQLSVTIENKAGLPLQDLEVAILPIGGGTAFTHIVGRMDGGERRESAIDEFRDRDGMRLSLRTVRVKTLRVTAKDLNGKAYNVEVPWP